MSAIDLSLVIATRNRADQLERCLAAVARIGSRRSWELVIVDNGSSDRTAEVVRAFRGSAALPVVSAFTSRRGLGHAHNEGLAQARGAIIAFTDDDCYPAPDYIDRILEIFEDPAIGYIGGRIRLFDPHDWPIAIVDRDNPRIIQPFTYIDGPDMKLLGANMAFRRSVLAEIGGFDSGFGVGSRFNCEDVDTFARASFAGWKGGYFPAPTVFHHHGRRESDARDLARDYAIARGAYFVKFMLRRDSGPLYAREWLRRSARELRLRPRDILQEITGGVSYLGQRLAERLLNAHRPGCASRSVKGRA